MLQRVEAEIRQVGGFGMAEDAEDAAFVFELVDIVFGPGDVSRQTGPLAFYAFDRRRPRAAPASAHARLVDRGQSPAPATRIRIRRRSRPIAAAGTPGGAVTRRSNPATSSGDADTTTRDADSPNNVAATGRPPSRRRLTAGRSTPRRPCRRCRNSTRPASPPGRRRRNRAPTASAARRRVDEQQLQRRARAPRSSAGGTPRTRSCITLRYSLPPSSPRSLAQAGRWRRPPALEQRG